MRINKSYKIYKLTREDSDHEWVCDFTGTEKELEIVMKQVKLNNLCYGVLAKDDNPVFYTIHAITDDDDDQ